jgi:hypothetical protein
MATVPKAERQVQAERGPVVFQEQQRIDAPALAFGDQGAGLQALGAGLGQASDVLGQMAMDKLAQDNTREMKNLDTEYSTAIREAMYGTPQNPGGFYSTRGQDTLDQHPGVAEDLEKLRQDILERASSPRVRAKLEETTSARRESEFNSMMVFSEKNRRVANDLTAESRIADASANVAAKINTEDGPAALRQGLTILSHEVMDMADRNGWSPETTTAKMMEAQSAMLKGAFDNIIEDNPAKARVFFDNNKHLIDGRMWDNMEAQLETGEQLQKEQEASEAILTRFPNDRQAQLDAAKELDSEIQDGVRQRIQDDMATEKRIKAEAEERNFDDVWKQVQDQGSLDGVPVAALTALNPTQHKALRAYIEQRAEDGTGFAPANNVEIYNELASMTPEQLMATNLVDAKYIRGLDRAGWEKFSRDRQQFIKEANAPGGKQPTSQRTSARIRSDLIKALKLKGQKALDRTTR